MAVKREDLHVVKLWDQERFQDRRSELLSMTLVALVVRTWWDHVRQSTTRSLVGHPRTDATHAGTSGATGM